MQDGAIYRVNNPGREKVAKVSESEKTRGNPLATAEEKEKALEAARLQIEKQFGAGSLIKLGTRNGMAGIEVIPSGSILLDEALGIGGYPRGRIIEIYGPESSGKTTLALHAIAEAQKMGGFVAFIDAEHALDPIYAKNLGVNTDELLISQPDSGEQALEITENLVRSGALDVIVVDSVAALTPQAEIDGDMGDAQMGLQARLMSQAMRKLTAIIGKSRTVLIFINQIRMKIGMLFGNPETTTGGNALKFYSSLRLEVRKTETIEAGKDTDAIGNRVKVKVAKNKLAPPFRKAELEIIFGKGVSAIGSLLDAAVKHNIIDKKGAWFAYGEEKVGQGRENAREFLEKNPGIAREVEEKLRKIMFPGRKFPAASSPAAQADARAIVQAAAQGAQVSPEGAAAQAADSASQAPQPAQAADPGPQAPQQAARTGFPSPAPGPEAGTVPPALETDAGAAVSPAPAAAPSRPAPGPAAAAAPAPQAAPARPAPGPAVPAQPRGPGRPRKNPLPPNPAGDDLF
jgi:recombination protein RecA